MGQEFCFFNFRRKYESDTENGQILNYPFNVPNLNNTIPQKVNNSLDNINDGDFNNILNAKNKQNNEEFFMTENNEIIEQMKDINSNQKSNFYSGLEEYIYLSEEKQINDDVVHLYENSENYDTFKQGIKSNNKSNQIQNFDTKIDKIDIKNEIIFNGMDIDDSFIVEQFCVEELINGETDEDSNSYPTKKEEKNERNLNNSCKGDDYEKTKKILKEFIEKKEGELKFEFWDDNDFGETKEPNFETTENLNENHGKVKASKISEQIESNKDEKSDISNLKRKTLKNTETNKNIFYIEKKNKSVIKTDSFNEVKVLQDKSNSSTKDSLSSNNASNSLFKSQVCLFSDISNVEHKNSIFNITKISKDESYIFDSNFAFKQDSEILQKFNISSINGSRINKFENVHNNLSANNIEHFQDETYEADEEFLKSKRKRFTKLIKSEMRTLYDFEKNIYREFASYLSDKEEKYKNISSLDDNFWEIIHIKDISKSNIEFEGKKIKSFSHKLIKYIFSKDEISNIYEDFLKDKVFHKKYISQHIKRTEYKNNNSYQLYKKNIHKIYCKKYKESEFELNENKIS